MKQFDCFTLNKDLESPEVKQGMRGVVLDIYQHDGAMEVEFPRKDGSNYGDRTFTILPSDTVEWS